MRRILRSAFLTAALAATVASGVARAQAIPFDIEVGYRFLSVTGNEEMYRSQINDREGFLVRSLHIATDEKYAGFPLVDKFRIDGADLGAGGAGFLRLDAGLAGAYRLQFSYRNTQFFSAYQGFANPLGAIDRPADLGPHAQPVQRRPRDPSGQGDHADRRLHLELALGPGSTTYHFGQDEFRLAQDLTAATRSSASARPSTRGRSPANSSRAGASTTRPRTTRSLRSRGTATTSVPVLGNNVTANSLTRSSMTDVNVPVTSAFVRAFRASEPPALGLLRALERHGRRRHEGRRLRQLRLVRDLPVLHGLLGEQHDVSDEPRVARRRPGRVARLQRPRRLGRVHGARPDLGQPGAAQRPVHRHGDVHGRLAGGLPVPPLDADVPRAQGAGLRRPGFRALLRAVRRPPRLLPHQPGPDRCRGSGGDRRPRRPGRHVQPQHRPLRRRAHVHDVRLQPHGRGRVRRRERRDHAGRLPHAQPRARPPHVEGPRTGSRSVPRGSGSTRRTTTPGRTTRTRRPPRTTRRTSP